MAEGRWTEVEGQVTTRREAHELRSDNYALSEENDTQKSGMTGESSPSEDHDTP